MRVYLQELLCAPEVSVNYIEPVLHLFLSVYKSFVQHLEVSVFKSLCCIWAFLSHRALFCICACLQSTRAMSDLDLFRSANHWLSGERLSDERNGNFKK